jgi:hypothetical protein
MHSSWTSHLATRGDADVLTRGYKHLLMIETADVYKEHVGPGRNGRTFREAGDKGRRGTGKGCEEPVHYSVYLSTIRYVPQGLPPLENGGGLGSTKLRVNPASAFPTPPSGHTVCSSLAPWRQPLTSYEQSAIRQGQYRNRVGCKKGE